MEKNQKAGSHQAEEKKTELLIQEAFGYSDEQLLKELEMAENAVRAAKNAEQNETEEKQDSQEEFELILQKMKERGIRPRLESELGDSEVPDFAEPESHLRSGEISPPERPPEPGRVFRKKRRAWKILIAAVVAGSLLWGTGIGVGGRRSLEYKANVRDGSGSNIAWDNNEENLIMYTEEEAYQAIKEKLGMPVLKLGYRPDGMEYQETLIEDSRATMEFAYGEFKIYLWQTMETDVNSNAFKSDRTEYKTVYNAWLDKEFLIEKNEGEAAEYDAVLEMDKMCYYLEGIMKEEEFLKIVEDMRFY